MQFTPKTDRELDEANLLPPGEYPALVVEAEDATSKSGREMVHLQLQIQTPTGPHYRTVDDYLVPGTGMEFKVRHFAYSAGLEAKYEQGNYSAVDCLGKGCTVKVDIEDASGQYRAKNRIVDYLVVDGAQVPAGAGSGHTLAPLPNGLNGEPVEDDSIPF